MAQVAQAGTATGPARRWLLIVGLGMPVIASIPTSFSSNGRAATGSDTARGLFREFCVKCHGTDGTGSPGRKTFPGIPDFTAPSRLKARSETQLLTSILDGKNKKMPSFRDKIKEEQARALAAYVRSFATNPDEPGARKQQAPRSSNDFEAEFGRLEKKMDALKKQRRQLPTGSADNKRQAQSQGTDATHSGSMAPSAAAAGVLFQKHCAKCHGADGRGSQARDRLPELPDFTVAGWQGQRRDPQLQASILEGKGKKMPSWRGKISDQEARDLVLHVRAFAASTSGSGGQEQPPPSPDETAKAQPTDGFLAKLTGWLGKFHPAAVHFPIALLAAAAVAEVLRLASGQPAFNVVSRYCVWFAALTAVVAGTLGWLRGGFRLTDASWILMTHRWLGTSTVVCAGLVLGLSETGRRHERPLVRVSVRVALLVAALLALITGFFGWAVVNGLEHYAWPP